MVYFIQAGDNGPIKIGSSRNPQERLGMLQVGNHAELKMIATVPGSVPLEREVQEDLKAFRRGREWFDPTPEVLDYIEKIQLVDYEIIDGMPLAVLWREKEDGETNYCPFCGERHKHEEKDGHYAVGCWWRHGERKLLDGTILKREAGYIVRTKSLQLPLEYH